METPDAQNYVGKYYTVNRETETLLFDGTYLRDGMVVVSGEMNDRDDLKEEIRDEAELYERNMYSRWCTISHVRIEKLHYRNIPQVSFIATYEDGNQIKQTFPVPKSWIVKNDSIPPEKYSSEWKQKIEYEIGEALTMVMESGKIQFDGDSFGVGKDLKQSTVRRIMKSINEIISETMFDQVYYGGPSETLPEYSKKDAEATMAMFDKLHIPLSKDDFIRICWADILGVVTKAVEKLEKFAKDGEVDPTANSAKIADDIIDVIYPRIRICRKPVRTSPFEVVDFDGKNEPGGHILVDPNPTEKYNDTVSRMRLKYDGPGSNAWAEKNPKLPLDKDENRLFTVHKGECKLNRDNDPHPTRVDIPVYVPEPDFGPVKSELVGTDEALDAIQRKLDKAGNVHHCNDPECEKLGDKWDHPYRLMVHGSEPSTDVPEGMIRVKQLGTENTAVIDPREVSPSTGISLEVLEERSRQLIRGPIHPSDEEKSA